MVDQGDAPPGGGAEPERGGGTEPIPSPFTPGASTAGTPPSEQTARRGHSYGSSSPQQQPQPGTPFSGGRPYGQSAYGQPQQPPYGQQTRQPGYQPQGYGQRPIQGAGWPPGNQPPGWGGPPGHQPSPYGYPPGSPPPKPKQKRRIGLAALVTIVALTALVCGGVGGLTGTLVTADRQSEASSSPSPTPSSASSVAAVAKMATPSVVAIDVRTLNGHASGSGFVVSKDGHIVTNNHVVEGASSTGQIKVEFADGDRVDATVEGTSASADIAVLDVDKPGLKPLRYAKPDSLTVGQSVIAIGSPLRLNETVTTGIVSALDRPVHVMQHSDSYYNAIQTDAAINPGNSGGPLLNEKGEIVGVNYAGAAVPQENGGGQAGSIGLGFAIPGKLAKRTAGQLIKSGKSTHAILGVRTDDSFTGDGARIPESGPDGGPGLAPDGPAATAGLHSGDVIVSIADHPIHNYVDAIATVRSHVPRERVKVGYVRDGTQHTVKVTLGEADDEQ